MKENNQDKSELLRQWFKIKLGVHQKDKQKLFSEGDIWWCNFGENIGVEMNGKNAPFSRPAIVFKKYNKHSFMAIPLTSQPHKGSWYVEFEFKSKKSWANLAQARSFSSKRLSNQIGKMTKGDFHKVQIGFHNFYCEKMD